MKKVSFSFAGSITLLLLQLTGCSVLPDQLFTRQQPRRYDAALCLKQTFDRQDRREQNRAFLNDRLIELSRGMEDLASVDINRYQTIEQAYIQWSVGSGYGVDLAGLDAANNQQVRYVIDEIAVFYKAVSTTRTVAFQSSKKAPKKAQPAPALKKSPARAVRQSPPRRGPPVR